MSRKLTSYLRIKTKQYLWYIIQPYILKIKSRSEEYWILGLREKTSIRALIWRHEVYFSFNTIPSKFLLRSFRIVESTNSWTYRRWTVPTIFSSLRIREMGTTTVKRNGLSHLKHLCFHSERLQRGIGSILDSSACIVKKSHWSYREKQLEHLQSQTCSEPVYGQIWGDFAKCQLQRKVSEAYLPFLHWWCWDLFNKLR